MEFLFLLSFVSTLLNYKPSAIGFKKKMVE